MGKELYVSTLIRNVYEAAGMKLTGIPQFEFEGSRYKACRFELNNRTIFFRVAKTTPIKIGQFVTLWKRSTSKAVIAPLDISDGVDFVVITVSDAAHHGQFVFNQKFLVETGIISRDHKDGKLSFRLYPPWTKPMSKIALKTQLRQLHYFFPIAQNGTADSALVRKLFNV